VDLVAADAGHDVGNREVVDAACGQHLDAPGRPADQAGAVVRRLLLAVGQQPPETQPDELVRRRQRFGGDVEGAVEDRLPARGLAPQAAAAVQIDMALLGQDAEDDAVGAAGLGRSTHAGRIRPDGLQSRAFILV
jgi:hypothetical protein